MTCGRSASVRHASGATFEQVLAENSTPTWAGVPVDADKALRLSSAWACVRLLADTVSTLPVDVFRDGSRDPLPLPPLLRTPAAGSTRQEFIEAAMRSLLFGAATRTGSSPPGPAQPCCPPRSSCSTPTW